MQTELVQSYRRKIVVVAATLAAFCCGAAQAADGWRNVLPAAAPGCSQGTPYSFWAKEGDPTKLAVILSGGGACWTGENCALHGKPYYRPFAGLEQDPSKLGGVFGTDNPENRRVSFTVIPVRRSCSRKIR